MRFSPSGFATKTIPQGAPLPTEHSKITIVHGIGCSLNLSISSSYFSLLLSLLFFCFWAYGCGLLSVGKQSIGKLCRMSRHPLLQKARTFGLGPPHPPRKSITDFKKKNHLTYKVVWLIRGGGGSKAKSPAFCNGSNCEQGLYACLWSGHLFSFHTSQYRFI